MVNIKSYGFVLAAISLFVALNLWLVVAPVNSAPDLAPAARPTVSPGDGGGGGGTGAGGTGGGGTGGSGSSELRCASLTGQVLNWGFGPQEGVGVELKTGSWRVAATSASDGNYGLGGLGVGIARLDVAVAPELGGQLEPLLDNAAVYLTCDFPIIANLAIGGSEINPPATIEMSAPSGLTADSNVPIRLTVKNDLPNEITNVIVTDLMPAGLVALEVQAAAVDETNAWIVDGGDDGQLVVVYLDKLAAGVETNIFITVTAAGDVLLNTQVRNSATLFYRESVADQASLEFTISGSGVPIAAAVDIGSEESADEAASVSADTQVESTADEAFVPPTEESSTAAGEPVPAAVETETEDEVIPPGNMPTTGGEFDPLDEIATNDIGPVIAPEQSSPNAAAQLADDTTIDDPTLTETNLAGVVEPSRSPVTYISAVLLLVVLIGLSSRSFSTHRSHLPYENKE